MKTFFKNRKLNIICSAAAIILMLAVWLIAYACVKNEYIVPSVGASFKSLGKLFVSAQFWTAFGWTFLRTVEAFIFSFLLAAAFAALSTLSKCFAATIKPVISVLRTLPTLAIVLILLIWTTPKTAPVIVTVLVLFPIIYSRLIAAIGGIDGGLSDMAKVYRIGKRDVLFKIYLPQTLPNILPQIGADISLGLKVTISAEVLASTYKSLGGLMQNARLYLDMPRLAALTVITVLIGLVIDFAFAQLARVTYKWSRKEGARD
ncbi:MAG: ABC transporter permease subunit [Clostridia bacterium]|nr:ABC transporter permease subunit [Clostridia bacterium]